MKRLILLIALITYISGYTQSLIIIEQDYNKAKKLALKENKMLFVDFYTTWCAPCKKLEKLIFSNESIKKELGKNFILLKYNAEKDDEFHLSKKHHISSYPTGLILNKNGYVLTRKYGFPGEDFKSLKKSVFEFTNQGIILNKENKILKGYSNKIDVSKYPKFYIDNVNRKNIKINDKEFKEYWNKNHDIFSEEYFSTLTYFGKDNIPNKVADNLLKNKQKYKELYGENDVNIALYFIGSGKFRSAIANNSQTEFNNAEHFIKEALSEDWTKTIIFNNKLNFLIAQNKWDKVFKINKELKDKGEFSDGAVNHFCWAVYKKCNDQKVIAKSINWMKEITNKNPEFAYLDTYAFLLHKSGNNKDAKAVAKRAITIGKKENESTKSLEKLLEKL